MARITLTELAWRGYQCGPSAHGEEVASVQRCPCRVIEVVVSLHRV